MLKYFAYGSNISKHRMMTERKINFISRKFAILENYKLLFNKVSKKNNYMGFANIIESDGYYVEGALYEINETDIGIIDRFEGVPNHYYKKNIDVICDGKIVRAISYIANPIMIKENISPNKNYLNYILDGKDLFSDEYYKKLQMVKTLD